MVRKQNPDSSQPREQILSEPTGSKDKANLSLLASTSTNLSSMLMSFDVDGARTVTNRTGSVPCVSTASEMAGSLQP